MKLDIEIHNSSSLSRVDELAKQKAEHEKLWKIALNLHVVGKNRITSENIIELLVLGNILKIEIAHAKFCALSNSLLKFFAARADYFENKESTVQAFLFILHLKRFLDPIYVDSQSFAKTELVLNQEDTRFVQELADHIDQEQIDGISTKVKGNTLTLSANLPNPRAHLPTSSPQE